MVFLRVAAVGWFGFGVVGVLGVLTALGVLR